MDKSDNYNGLSISTSDFILEIKDISGGDDEEWCLTISLIKKSHKENVEWVNVQFSCLCVVVILKMLAEEQI